MPLFKLTVLLLSFTLTACSFLNIKKLDVKPSEYVDRSSQTKKQVLVTIPISRVSENKEQIAVITDTYGIKLVSTWPLKSIGQLSAVFELTDAQLTDDTISKMAADSSITAVQKMKMFQVFLGRALEPREHAKSMEHLQKAIQSLGIIEAHKHATGKNIRIAIIDSGMDINHPEYRRNIEEVKNFVEKPLRSFTSDLHGTAIAGIIASNTRRHEGITGVSPDASILAFKACWQTGEQWGKAYCNSYSLVKAINTAILRKVDILNLSLGGSYDRLIYQLIQKAMQNNITVVAATGPYKRNKISFPAAIPGVIAVNSNTDISKIIKIENESNFSILEPEKKLCAPSTNVITTTPGSNYNYFSGSSLSAAFVSGSIALLLEKDPTLTPKRIFRLLARSASNNSRTNIKNLNSCAALELLMNKSICK